MMKVRSRILAAASIGLLYLNLGSVAMAGTLLPNGMQYFTDNNGLPLSAGCAYFYIPGTLTPKDTYLNAEQTVSNTNPVQLDAAGRAIIYGTGTYRQIVKAAPCGSTGVQIWDQLTAATDTSNTIFAGASAGTPNAITVTAPAFSGSDGQVINYISTSTNTGGATFNPSGFGAVQIVRDSSTGPQALTGGELVATNAVSLIYDATAGTFHILSPVTWPNTAGVSVGTIMPFAGFTAPTGYAFAYGQAVSRTTFGSLLSALTLAQTASLSSGSPTITGLADTTQLGLGQAVEAVGIQAGTTIVSCTVNTCTLSANATATRTGTVTFFAYGNGDGSTTFNLPDARGAYFAGRTNMGEPGTPGKTNITTAFLNVSPTITGALGGAQSQTLAVGNLPPYTPTGTITNGAITPSVNGNTPVRIGNSTTSVVSSGTSPVVTDTGTLVLSQATSTFAGVAQGGSSAAFSRLPPTMMVNWLVRLTP